MEIIEALATGETRRAVALQLGISVHTVDSHLGRAYGKLGCHVACHAVAILCGLDKNPPD